FAGAPTAEGVAKMEKIWRGIRRHDVFPVTVRSVLDFLLRRRPLVDPGGLRALVKDSLSYELLEKAPVPVHVVATDLMGGAAVCLSEGPAVDAILASSAIPAAFPAVTIGGKALIDGAVASNSPVRVALDLGATRIVLLPTGFACTLESAPTSAI